MKRAFALVLWVLALSGPAAARPVSPYDPYRPEVPDLGLRSTRPSGLGVSSGAALDTVYYGGTFWASDSSRWEALRDSVWSFDTGIGSAIENGTNPNKPAGYHRLMEGWSGIDQTLNPLPYFRRSATCAISGTWSAWAGVTTAEANALCYASGQGYGNDWDVELWKTLAVSGSTGSATLTYKYRCEVENGFDFAFALIDTSGNGSAPDIVLRTYTSVSAGAFQTETVTLARGASLRTTPGNVMLKFVVDSDASYSDEDGLNATTCGAFVVDDISLTGTITDVTDFEAGANGWIAGVPTTGVGDFSNIVNRNTELPPTIAFCACGVRDSVLVFYDLLEQHPLDQDNIARSPWINLRRNGGIDRGRPGRLMSYDVYAELPLSNYVFVLIRARWYPSVCASTGILYRTPFRDAGIVYYFGEAPFCNPPGLPRQVDFSGVIEQGAEQIQVAWGAINLCRTAPFGVPCSGATNTTPWLDNISLGVYGPANGPSVSLTAFDYLQDSFATDGSLNPASTGRLDTNAIKNAAAPGPGAILRDTLVARGDGGNTEVRLVFHVRPGPFTQPAALMAWSAKWTPEPSLGSGWFSARMDTAEQGGAVAVPRNWMACFHESDPGFSGTDRTPDPIDPSQNANEILPDHVLTPGSRVDYFVKARFIPPDPRNPGGTAWYVTPDTTGGRYAEVEILPSSTAADTTWSCVLYVDHHEDRERDQQFLEELGLKTSLGPGGTNAEGTKYDRWDDQTPSSNQLSFGRPFSSTIGASILQAFAFSAIVWHSGSLSSVQLTLEDAGVLNPWLTLRGTPGARRFWGSGDGLATSMNGSGQPSVVNFLRTVLGTLRTCNTVREASCPAGAALDSTYCLPLLPVVGSEFVSTFPASARGNGCPDLRSFDLLNRNSAVATSKGQLNYQKSGDPLSFASVTNYNTLDVDWKTVLDGFGVGTLRGLSGNPHISPSCSGTGPAVDRTDQVLDWFATVNRCRIPGQTASPDSGNPHAPKYRLSLGNAQPNPMGSRTRIPFLTEGAASRVRIQVFDVTGRLVVTLADAVYPEGRHEVTWDGRDQAGGLVPAGLYFYRLSSGSFGTSRKLMLLK